MTMRNENKIMEIVVDGLILFGVSTVLVVVADIGFSRLKGKVPKDDPIVAAISQGEIKAVEDAVIAANKSGGTSGITATDEHGRTSLMRAAYANLSNAEGLAKQEKSRSAVVTLLLDNGAEINAADKDGWTALMWASWSGMPEVVNTLLARGASVGNADRQGNTALTISAQRGNPAIVKALVEKGADLTAKTKTGQTALDIAKSTMTDYPKKKNDYKDILKTLGGY